MLVAPASSRYIEMTREFSGAVEPSAAPWRKRAREVRGAFDVMEVFAVAKMTGKERNLLRERFQEDLVAIRGLLAKADHVLVPRAIKGGAAPSSSPGLAPAPRGKDGRFLVSTEADDGTTVKRRKTSPLAEHREEPTMTPVEKEQLAFRLAALSAELSAQAVKLLQNQGQRHDRRDELQVDVCSMEDAALFELKMLVDKFVKTRDPSPAPHRKIIEDDDDGDHQDDECVDICGGVSPPVAAIAPSPVQLEILEYGDVFDATGLVDKLLSPLPQKCLALAEKREEEEYVDICGDASPVVIQSLGATRRSPSIISVSDSDSHSGSDSDFSDSDSSSDSGSDMDISPAPAVLPMVNEDSAPPPEPAPAVLPMVNEYSAPPSEPAPEVVQIAEPERRSSPPGMVEIAEAEKLSCPAPAVLPKVNVVSSLPSEPAPVLVVQNAELEELPDQPVTWPPARSMGELIAGAQEKRRREERSRAREKVRQDLEETKRLAMTSDRVHPMEMQELGIASVEHIVSQRRRRPDVPPSLLEQLGLFLKAEEDGGEEEEQPISDAGVEELEEGEFRM
ncbi:hypothetical protein QYE76_023314 [Lolium multiflorum]|uniref:NET domain-containing protein n=1 Tax=Lolium multiflorum TaxID=4521 RepID=A0AAD8RB57_LOLMU|nr:hypothetical protein QYE76_023314 [Lolium multiflorum]